MSEYKQSYVVVMENGAIVLWTGYAEDTKHGEGKAIATAQERHDCQVWDIANRPVTDKE